MFRKTTDDGTIISQDRECEKTQGRYNITCIARITPQADFRFATTLLEKNL